MEQSAPTTRSLSPLAYRVYDKLAMRYVCDEKPLGFTGLVIQYAISNLGVLLEHNWLNVHVSNPDRYVVERFTGTYDDAGQPIFEGDIVDGQDSNGWELPPDQCRVVVRWGEDRLRWEAFDPWNRETFELGDYGPLDAVVGNVNENRGLLPPESENE